MLDIARTSVLPSPTREIASDQCWWLPKTRPVFVLGGRYGDIILVSGCLHEIWRRTGKRPFMFTSKDYVDIYDGMSYVDYRSMPQNWWECVDPARRIAEAEFGGATVVQWWNGTPKNEDTIGFKGKNVAVVQCHGRNWGIDMKLDPDFGSSMTRRLGFSREEWLSLPPVFDRRSAARESILIQHHIKESKPTLLYNFTGISSPFAYVPEMMRVLHDYKNRFHMVDLGQIHAPRIYDLLGLYEQSKGLITIDTSTGHLAPATNIPTIWLTVPGWCRSVPRGNVRFTCPYSEVPANLANIRKAIDSLL